MTLSAVVIGLGRIGSRFDEEPGRDAVWSHVGAYQACADEVRLVGAVEPRQDNRIAFGERCPGVPVMETAEALFATVQPDIVSICTPYGSHAAVLDTSLSCDSVKAIWCEKPLAGSLEESERMVAACQSRGVPLVVSHVRRWMPLWQRMADRIRNGDVGDLVSLRVAMPNRLFSIGSHAIDLALMLGGRAADAVALPIPSLEEDGEPAVSALVAFESGASGVVQVTGRKANLVIEAEAFGTQGRLSAREDTGTLQLETFSPSSRYAGYETLGDPVTEVVGDLDSSSPFVAIAREVAALAQNPDQPATCDGAGALAVQRLLLSLSQAADNHSL